MTAMATNKKQPAAKAISGGASTFIRLQVEKPLNTTEILSDIHEAHLADLMWWIDAARQFGFTVTMEKAAN